MFGFSRTPELLSQEDKINYLYDEMKKDESHRRWSRIWSWMWRIFIIVSTYWLYLHPETLLNLIPGSMAKTGVSGQIQPGTNNIANILSGVGGGGMTEVSGVGQPANIEELVK